MSTDGATLTDIEEKDEEVHDKNSYRGVCLMWDKEAFVDAMC